MIEVVFVCLGNICRSPMAEAIFQNLVEEAGLSDRFRIESRGIAGYHVGEPAHRGTRRVLADHGIEYRGVSQQVTRPELQQADYVIAMDRSNMSDLQAMARGHALNGRMHLLLEFAEGVDVTGVPDPYYEHNFERVYQLVKAGCEGLLAHIRREHNM